LLPPNLLRLKGAGASTNKQKAWTFLGGQTPKGRTPMKTIMSMIVAVGLSCAFSGSAFAAAIHCAASKDCPSNMQCSIKSHHNTGICVGAQAKKKSFYY
jgi:hypothetical protein